MLGTSDTESKAISEKHHDDTLDITVKKHATKYFLLSIERLGIIKALTLVFVGVLICAYVVYQLKPYLIDNQVALDSAKTSIVNLQERLKSEEDQRKSTMNEVKKTHTADLEAMKSKYEKEIASLKSIISDYEKKSTQTPLESLVYDLYSSLNDGQESGTANTFGNGRYTLVTGDNCEITIKNNYNRSVKDQTHKFSVGESYDFKFEQDSINFVFRFKGGAPDSSGNVENANSCIFSVHMLGAPTTKR